MFFCLFWSQWLKCIKMCNKVVIYRESKRNNEKGKKRWSNVKTLFSNAMLSCYLYFFLLLTFQTCHKKDSKTKALNTLHERFSNFESRKENIVFLKKYNKLINEKVLIIEVRKRGSNVFLKKVSREVGWEHLFRT